MFRYPLLGLLLLLCAVTSTLSKAVSSRETERNAPSRGNNWGDSDWKKRNAAGAFIKTADKRHSSILDEATWGSSSASSRSALWGKNDGNRRSIMGHEEHSSDEHDDEEMKTRAFKGLFDWANAKRKRAETKRADHPGNEHVMKSRDYGGMLGWENAYGSSGGSNTWPRKRTSATDDDPGDEHNMKSRDYGGMLGWENAYGSSGGSNTWPRKRTSVTAEHAMKSRDYGGMLGWENAYGSSGGSNTWPRKRTSVMRDVDHPGNEEHRLKSRNYGSVLGWGNSGSSGGSNSWPKKRAPVNAADKKKRGGWSDRWDAGTDSDNNGKRVARSVDDQPQRRDEDLERTKDYIGIISWPSSQDSPYPDIWDDDWPGK